MADRCLHGARVMVPDQVQSYVPRSSASLNNIVRRADLQTKPQALQVSRVLRELQVGAAAFGSPLTLAVDDTVHLPLDEALLSTAISPLLDYAAEHGAEALVLRLTSEEPGVVLELEIDGTHLASKIWQELQSSAPHSPALGRAAHAFHEMQAELELQHTGETSASLVILFPVQRVTSGAAAE
jgi:hypothetical protein